MFFIYLVQAQTQCSCSPIATMMNMSGSGMRMSSSGDEMLNITGTYSITSYLDSVYYNYYTPIAVF